MIDGKFGFGIVGCGLISDFHGNAVTAAEEGQVVAATDLDKERLVDFCARFECDQAEGFEAMLHDDRIDVINVCTPNAMHAMFAVPAMQASKHVIVEKPPEMALEKCDQMIAARDGNNVKCAISLQVRFRKPIEAIKQAIEEGRFGKLLQGDAYMKWYRSTEYYLSDDWRSKRDQGAGVTIQHAFHYIDLLHHLLGPCAAVHAEMTNLAHPQVELEDTLDAFLKFQSGAKGTVQASTALWPGTDIRIEVNGEDGTAIMLGETITTWQFKQERPGDEQMTQIGDRSQTTAAAGAADFAFTEHKYMVEDMIEAIKTDGSPRVSLESARHSLQIALAMYESADAGAPVAL